MSTETPISPKYGWLQSRSGIVLHHIHGVDLDTWNEWWEQESVPGYKHPEVVAACGRRFAASLPGIFSRMGAPRCRGCCTRLGLPQGDGAPVNDVELNSEAAAAKAELTRLTREVEP